MGRNNLERGIPVWAYVLLVVVVFVITSFIIAHLRSPVDGAGTKMIKEARLVIYVSQGSPAEQAGISPGDQIIMIGGEYVSSLDHKNLLTKYDASESVPYLLKRDGEVFRVDVTLTSLWSRNQGFYISYYLLILIVCSTSLFILYKKPNDLTARIFFIYLQLFAIAQNFNFVFSDDLFVVIGTVLFLMSFNIFGIVLLHFHLVFPGQVIFYRKVRWILYSVYFIGAFTGLLISIAFLRRITIGSDETIQMLNFFSRLSVRWMAITLLLALIVAIYQFVKAKSKSSKKQLRLVVIGSVFGLIVPILYGLFPEIIWRLEHERQLLNMLEMANGTGTYIMTSFLAVAIFRYRIWNVEIFVRKAILYSAATSIILICYFSLLHIVNLLLIRENRLAHISILAVSLLIFLLVRDMIQRLIDRLFYRESYNSTKIAEEFEKRHAGIYEYDELSAMIVNSLDNIFHARSILLALHKQDQSYRIIRHKGVSKDVILEEFEITPETDYYLRAGKVFSIDEIRSKPILFNSCKGELVVPLMNKGNALGMIVLGTKISEKSYNLQDITLLSLLSNRMVALFNTADLYQANLTHRKLLEEERIRIAKDIHDEVGAKLTNLSIMSERAYTYGNGSSKANKWLQTIAETSRELTHDMTQIIWALSPQNSTIEGTLTYLRRYSIEYLEPSNIECQFHLPEKVQNIHLRPEIRRNVYLCIKEILNNIVKHSRASQVGISVVEDQKWFRILVKDNGRGFDPCNMILKGNGLSNLKSRMRVIGGKTRVRTRSGEGTEVVLMIPVFDAPALIKG